MCLPVCVYSVDVLDCIVLLYQHVCLITINNYPLITSTYKTLMRDRSWR